MYKYVLGIVCALAAAQTPKNYKDSGEYDLYNAVVKDIDSNSFPKALADLDAWKQKYPDSDFKDDREFFYVLAHAGGNQPAKAIDAAGELLPQQAALDPAKQ